MTIRTPSPLVRFGSVRLMRILPAILSIILLVINMNLTQDVLGPLHLPPDISMMDPQAQKEDPFASFDISNPIWPKNPPKRRRDCKVIFRDPGMSLCHITPWPNFGDELGPPVVKRILELVFGGCSAEESLSTFDLKRVYRGGGDMGFLNRTGSGLETCLMTVGSLWRMIKSGDHVWGPEWPTKAL